MELFKRHIEDLVRVGQSTEWRGPCPFPKCKGRAKHTFYASSITGQFFCHRCGKKGNAVSFAKYFGERPEPYYDRTPNPRPIDHREIIQYHQNLLKRPEHWRMPWKHHILQLLKVGWDDKLKTLTFPIFDPCGQIINFIAHKNYQVKGSKCTLYPAHLIENYDPSYLVLCEGMTDCISLLSIDIQVVTATNGASSIPKDLSILRKFKRIYLCFDVDEAGEAGCDRWISRLLSEMDR